MNSWKKVLRYFLIGTFSLLFVWFMGWVLFLAMFGGFNSPLFHMPSYVFGSTVAEEKNIGGFSAQEITGTELKITGYCGDDFTYPYKLKQEINGKKMSLKIFMRNFFVYPWLWKSIPRNGVAPTYFEYLVQIPKDVDSIVYGEDEKVLWVRNKNSFVRGRKQ